MDDPRLTRPQVVGVAFAFLIGYVVLAVGLLMVIQVVDSRQASVCKAQQDLVDFNMESYVKLRNGILAIPPAERTILAKKQLVTLNDGIERLGQIRCD